MSVENYNHKTKLVSFSINHHLGTQYVKYSRCEICGKVPNLGTFFMNDLGSKVFRAAQTESANVGKHEFI